MNITPEAWKNQYLAGYYGALAMVAQDAAPTLPPNQSQGERSGVVPPEPSGAAANRPARLEAESFGFPFGVLKSTPSASPPPRAVEQLAHAMIAAHDQIFDQCSSNEITNYRGKKVDCTLLNKAYCLARSALSSLPPLPAKPSEAAGEPRSMGLKPWQKAFIILFDGSPIAAFDDAAVKHRIPSDVLRQYAKDYAFDRRFLSWACAPILDGAQFDHLAEFKPSTAVAFTPKSPELAAVLDELAVADDITHNNDNFTGPDAAEKPGTWGNSKTCEKCGCALSAHGEGCPIQPDPSPLPEAAGERWYLNREMSFLILRRADTCDIFYAHCATTMATNWDESDIATYKLRIIPRAEAYDLAKSWRSPLPTLAESKVEGKGDVPWRYFAFGGDVYRAQLGLCEYRYASSPNCWCVSHAFNDIFDMEIFVRENRAREISAADAGEAGK